MFLLYALFLFLLDQHSLRAHRYGTEAFAGSIPGRIGICNKNKKLSVLKITRQKWNYETTWWTDFKTLRRFFSRNLIERSFAIVLFRSALFSLTCLFCISSEGSSCVEEFSYWDSVQFFLRYFFTRALVNSLFIFSLSLIGFLHPSSVTEDN